MENKVLVKLQVPLIEKEYEVFLPASKRIDEITVLLGKGLQEVSKGYYEVTFRERLYNRFTGKEYSFHQLLKNTDIRNGTELIFM